MVEITYQMVLSTLQTVGILVGIFYYIMTLRNTRKNQKLQLETRQVATYIQTIGFRDKEFMKAWADVTTQEYADPAEWESKYGANVNPDSYASFFSVCNLFQSVGFLVEQRVLTPEIVYEQEGAHLITAWETQRMIIEDRRTRLGYLHLFDHYESLYEHMIRLRSQELKT